MAISYKKLQNEVLSDIESMKYEQKQYFNRVVTCILNLKKYKKNMDTKKYYKILHSLHALLYVYNDNIQFYQNWYNRELKA